MTIKTRLKKLEALIPEIVAPIRVSRFIVLPNLDDPSGYMADNGAVIMRNPDETMAELKARCNESVVWIPGERHLFEAIA